VDRAEVRNRYIEIYLAVRAAINNAFHGVNPREGMEVMVREEANFRRAVGWALEQKGYDGRALRALLHVGAHDLDQLLGGLGLLLRGLLPGGVEHVEAHVVLDDLGDQPVQRAARGGDGLEDLVAALSSSSAFSTASSGPRMRRMRVMSFFFSRVVCMGAGALVAYPGRVSMALGSRRRAAWARELVSRFETLEVAEEIAAAPVTLPRVSVYPRAVTTTPQIPRQGPSLRVAEMAITNFRTFRERTVIPFRGQDERADAVATFHGGNGSGKSNALAALDLFFRGLAAWMKQRPLLTTDDYPLRWNSPEAYAGLVPTLGDWPPGVRDPLVVEVHFAEARTPFSVMLIPAGNECLLRMEGVWAPGGAEAPSRPGPLGDAEGRYLSIIRNQFETPLGPGSMPLFRLDARRHDYRFGGEGTSPLHVSNGPLSPDLAGRLFDLSTSFDPVETERWRAFTKLVTRFVTLRGRELSVLRTRDGSAELRFEIRGKQILRVSELSSGEQQVVALCAALLASRAAVVAIEEPEISLDPEYQRLVRDILDERIVDQIIVESHVPSFDHENVIRFDRAPGGATQVTRVPAASPASAELVEKAKRAGAEDLWVTRDGYTKVPGKMCDDLAVGPGRHIWFLKVSGRWGAWPEDELNRMLGGEEGE
jgi:hypothetical protein